jgi:hypothetical protein
MNPDDFVININNSTLSISLSEQEYNVGDITLSTDGMQVYGNHDWISITGDSGSIDLNNITIVEPVEFEDQMPSVAKIEDMCNDYPALEKAYENFKTIYKMVHQDWQGKQDAEK